MSGGTLALPVSPSWTSPFPSSFQNISSQYSEPSKILSPQIPRVTILPEEKILAQDLPGSKDYVLQTQKLISFFSKQPFTETLSRMSSSVPAKYDGSVSPESLRSCHLVARKLGDTYDPQTKRLTQTKFIHHDYFGIIAQEQTQGRTLVVMDRDWVLPRLAEYLKEAKEIGTNRSQILRENIAVYNPVTSSDIPYTGWDTRPNFPKLTWSLDDIVIYSFHDAEIGSLQDEVDWAQYDPSVMMIFAKVNADQAESAYMYIHRAQQYYSATAYLAVKDLPLSRAQDFEHLFPVKLSFVRNYVIFSSLEMSRSELVEAFYFQRVSRKFSHLDPLMGAYGSYLLAESTFYEIPLSWENSRLSFQDVGYLQAQDLFEHFGNILTNIISEKVYYQKLTNYATAAHLSSTSDVKCFRMEGSYYAAVPEQIEVEEIETKLPTHLSVVELKGPLQSMQVYPKSTQEYLESLGYEVSENPESYFLNIDLGYRTYQHLNKKFTVYYYRNSSEQEVDIYENEGPWSRDLFQELQKFLRKGFFFNPRMKLITRGYPGFIPSEPPLYRNLSPYPEKALLQLQRISEFSA